MKKKYIIPTSKGINLTSESPLLSHSLTGNDGQIGSGNTDKQETRKQDFINTPWENWSE